jgi:hypothetical protein
MRVFLSSVAALILGVASVSAQSGPTVPPPNPVADVTTLISRLSLENYKATVKGLTQFGDRRQGTERNRKAVDWIEAQLKSYGCPTERITYVYDPPPPAPRPAGAPAAAGSSSRRPAACPASQGAADRPGASARRRA